MGTTGLGDMTLMSSNEMAKKSFVAGLLFERAFV
jgi:hypothetical protein